jgi:hypothetical protein
MEYISTASNQGNDMSILVFTKEDSPLEKPCALLPDNAKAY